jgi:hypothetical protein
MSRHIRKYRSQYRNALDSKGRVHILGNPLEELESLADFMKDIIYGDEMPYTNFRNGNTVYFRETALGRKMGALSAWASMYDGDLAYSPEIQHFFDVYRSHSVRQCSNTDYRGLEFKKELNKFADDLRRKARREDIKEKTKNWRRNFVESKKRIESYVSTLCDHYAHLMVINLDFRNHKSTIKDESDARISRSNLLNRQFEQREAFMSMNEDVKNQILEPSYRVGFDEISNDWERLKTNMRGKPSLFRHLVGYISRFDFTSHGGYHLQLAVLFDGSKIDVDQRLGEQIGNYWTNITDGRGYSVRCDPAKYPPREVGMDNYSREEKRAFLLDALNYFIRNGELAKVKTATGTKLLRTGKLPKKISARRKPRKE